MLITGAFPASSLAPSSFAFRLALLGQLGLRPAFWLLGVCLSGGSHQGLLGQEVGQLQLEAVRQVAAIGFTPCKYNWEVIFPVIPFSLLGTDTVRRQILRFSRGKPKPIQMVLTVTTGKAKPVALVWLLRECDARGMILCA